MSEVIKTGGVGKNPAIEKMNQLQAVHNAVQGACQLKEKAFIRPGKRGIEEIQKRRQIIDEFQISFQPRIQIGGEQNDHLSRRDPRKLSETGRIGELAASRKIVADAGTFRISDVRGRREKTRFSL